MRIVTDAYHAARGSDSKDRILLEKHMQPAVCGTKQGCEQHIKHCMQWEELRRLCVIFETNIEGLSNCLWSASKDFRGKV